MSRVSNRVNDLTQTAVNTILTEARAAGSDVISLMRGEPDIPTPPHIIEAASRSLTNGRTHYPDNLGETALREAVAVKLARDNGVSCDPGTEILVTTGATLGIHAALTALLNKDDEVLLPDPIYDAYQSTIVLAGGRPRSVPATITNNRFHLTVSALEVAWTPASRVLLLNTPWNPVGTVFHENELQAIADFALRRNLTLITDEIYEAIVYDGNTHLSLAALSPELREQTVLINSLSKTYAMTGWRVGYCTATEAITRAMFLVLQQSSRGPATFIQDAAVEALTGPQGCVIEMRNQYAKRRSAVLDALANIPGISAIPPEGGFFTMVDVRYAGRSSNEIRQYLLREFGVVVAHGSAYGSEGEGTLRVSFATGGDTLASGLVRLREGLAAL
jgi:aspartate/methionine/tyrosine aminotransferase